MINQKKIEKAIKEILLAIGEDPDREGLKETPKRVAALYADLFSGLNTDPAKELKTFQQGEHEEMVMLKDIPFYSICEHHLVPFIGRAHVVYIPTKGKITGLSKLIRVVDGFARRPQVQERLTSQVADCLMEKLKPQGVLVVVEAEHLCYDDKTEILTEEGWKLFKNLNKKNKVAQIEVNNNRRLTFVKPVRILSYSYKGKMIRINNLSIDLLVTPDHRMVYASEWKFYNNKKAKWQASPAAEVYKKNIVIPRACTWEGESPPFVKIGARKIPFFLFVKLFGIWVGEGCTTKTGNRRFFVVSQSPASRAFKEIRTLFDGLKIKYGAHKNGKTYQFRIEGDDFYDYFVKFGKSGDKYIPGLIKNASAKHLKLFLDWYVKGDGHIKKNGALHLVSKSERLINDLQEICIKLGIGCTKQNNKVYFRMETHKTKSGLDKWYSKLRPQNFSASKYDGKVYCVNVPSGFVLVRRNGRTAISGNCMSMRGVKKPGTKAVTSAVRGIFQKDAKARSEALSLIKS